MDALIIFSVAAGTIAVAFISLVALTLCAIYGAVTELRKELKRVRRDCLIVRVHADDLDDTQELLQ